MKIVIYGLTITSSWGNGHATTFRALAKALARRGHRINFIEKDVEWYRSHRDAPTLPYCTIHLYQEWERDWAHLLSVSAGADVVILGSYFPDAVQATYLFAERTCPLLFYDIDTPITLSGLRQHGHTAYLNSASIPAYAAYLSFTGGPVLDELQQRFGARWATAFYCSVDPEMYRPVAPEEAFRAELSYLGTYAADRQAKLMRLLDAPAAQEPQRRFLIAGPQYPSDIAWQPNVERIDHVPPAMHPAFYCSTRFTLNLTRQDMVEAGWSPSVRLFEASACGAAILSDTWDGLDTLLTPGEEILLVNNEREVLEVLRSVSAEERVRMGGRARERILDQHTSMHRAIQLEQIVSDLTGGSPPAATLQVKERIGRVVPPPTARD